MNYIIFDLEWDSAFYKPEKRFINQIIQIGAVRLNENFDIINRFEATVCSSISKKVTERFKTLTGITSEQMLAGMPYQKAVEEFNRFSNGAEVTMTWSDSDLYTIDENEKLLTEKTEFKINKYLDLQKLVQAKMREAGYESKNQVSLESAAEFFNIDISEFKTHTALDDSSICAYLLKRCYDGKIFNLLLRDATSPDFKNKLKFRAYPISNINDARLDKKQFEFICPVCKLKLRLTNKWRYRNRWFFANFKCDNCNEKFLGRVFAKVTFDGVTYKKRITKFKKKETNDDLPALSEKV